MHKKQNKYEYIKVIQTNYGYGDGWEDSTAAKTLKEAKGYLKDYRLNQPQHPHRLISRRELKV